MAKVRKYGPRWEAIAEQIHSPHCEAIVRDRIQQKVQTAKDDPPATDVVEFMADVRRALSPRSLKISRVFDKAKAEDLLGPVARQDPTALETIWMLALVARTTAFDRKERREVRAPAARNSLAKLQTKLDAAISSLEDLIGHSGDGLPISMNTSGNRETLAQMKTMREMTVVPKSRKPPNADEFTTDVIHGLAYAWMYVTATRPAFAKEGIFVDFVEAAWIDLDLPQGAHRDFKGWLGKRVQTAIKSWAGLELEVLR